MTVPDLEPTGRNPSPTIKVAIIGGGPGGLAAAIELGKLPFVQWTLYEKKPEISETGGGISLQRHTWRMLELMGAAGNITPGDYFRPSEGYTLQHRNSRTGHLLARGSAPKDTPPNQGSCRMVRPKLQQALLKEVDKTKIQTSKKLVKIERPSPSDESTGNKIRIIFEDGLEDEVDLLVGADGIRSVVRSYMFPTHRLSYIGQSAYRTLIRTSRVEERLRALNLDLDPLRGPIFWHNVGGKYVFTSPLGGDVFEVTARLRRPVEGQEQVSWGQPFDLHKILDLYDEFCPAVREVLQIAAGEGETQEFALFSGPRLESCVQIDKLDSDGPGTGIALIGDASHPLSGAFGAGAGFACEDVYTLARALEWAFRRNKGDGEEKRRGQAISNALRLYDSIRSPHYNRLYGVLDKTAAINGALVKEGLPVDEEISERIKRTWGDRSEWMYHYKADEVVAEAISEAEARETVAF